MRMTKVEKIRLERLRLARDFNIYLKIERSPLGVTGKMVAASDDPADIQAADLYNFLADEHVRLVN